MISEAAEVNIWIYHHWIEIWKQGLNWWYKLKQLHFHCQIWFSNLIIHWLIAMIYTTSDLNKFWLALIEPLSNSITWIIPIATKFELAA